MPAGCRQLCMLFMRNFVPITKPRVATINHQTTLRSGLSEAVFEVMLGEVLKVASFKSHRNLLSWMDSTIVLSGTVNTSPSFSVGI